MRRETNNDRQQRLFVTGLLISAVVGALIGLLWPLWFPADSACETTIPDASFSVPTLAMGGTQLPGEEGLQGDRWVRGREPVQGLCPGVPAGADRPVRQGVADLML